MCANENNTQTEVILDGLQEIFEALRQGRHICRADGKIFQQLNDQQDAFINIFAQLGFELKKHRRDFYYFFSTNTISEKTERIAVFMFILIEWITDQGHNIEDILMNQQFTCNELPHLTTERYRGILAQLNIFDQDDLANIITNMNRLGFTERINEDIFAFRHPIYRFLDICQEIAHKQKHEQTLMEDTEQ